ncbi:MAG: ACP phosphodiesterase [Leadbetterella sp.]
MNYLAHVFLAGYNPGMIVGNILEDYITGSIENKDNQLLPYHVKLGIQQHRIIDTFTDSHPIVKQSKSYFYEILGKYSPIITDVLYDHFLLMNWKTYTNEDFSACRNRIYKAFAEYKDIQPIGMQYLIQSMTEHDWLKNYEFDWGLERAFLNLNHKINKPEIDLKIAMPLFHSKYDNLNQEFNLFFPELKEICDNFIDENLRNGEEYQ